MRIPRYLGAVAGQLKRHVETHFTLTHRSQQSLVLPAAGIVTRQITHVFAGEDEGEGAFHLLRPRRTVLALGRFIIAQEAVGVVHVITGLQHRVLSVTGKQRMARCAAQVLGFAEQFAVIKRGLCH